MEVQRRSGIKTVDLVSRVRELLDEKHGRDVLVVDVRGLSEVTDFCVLASGTSPPHLKAMFGDVQHALKQEGVPCYRRTGSPDCGWMVLDYVDVVIHLFLDEQRRYYAIEDVWPGAPRLA